MIWSIPLFALSGDVHCFLTIPVVLDGLGLKEPKGNSQCSSGPISNARCLPQYHLLHHEAQTLNASAPLSQHSKYSNWYNLKPLIRYSPCVLKFLISDL